MATFFTADLHLCHGAIIRHCDRPFASVEEMNETIVSNWNAVVGRSDDVHVVGDLAIWRNKEDVPALFNRLKGRKHLIIGNHDDKRTLRLGWSSPPVDRREINVLGRTWVLDHYALRTWRNARKGAVHVFGHSHGGLSCYGMSTDVGVDLWDFRPATAEEVLARMHAQPSFLDAMAKVVEAGLVDPDQAPLNGP